MEAVGGEGRKRGRVKGGAGEGEEEGEAAEAAAKRRMVVVPWAQQQPSSRIYRVSRASGGKDRHSKVYTAKGIRDRRVRLSVATAIQFYDLQDRLGYDQPSKAIEWLIKAAAAAIDKLPELAGAFPAHPASAAKHADADADNHGSLLLQQQQQDHAGSGCSSTSETSKGSVLSLSRSESRVKARERARERSAATATTARDKDKDPGGGDSAAATARRAAPTTSAQAASFTELLTGMAAATAAAATAPAAAEQPPPPQASSWQPMAAVSATADYIGFAQPRKAPPAMEHAFASPAPHLGSIVPIAMAPAQHFGLTPGGGGGGGEPHSEMTHFSFLQDHFMPVHAAAAAAASGPAGDYNLNFSMSSGLVGVNSRGPLQSNSPPHLSGHHHHHQLQRLSTPLDAPNIPFLFSPAAAVAAPAAVENQFAAAFQLWDGFRHGDMKEKGKN
ncbi:hypothetical protein ACP4OV_012123 [Aristida adscensionis]